MHTNAKTLNRKTAATDQLWCVTTNSGPRRNSNRDLGDQCSFMCKGNKGNLNLDRNRQKSYCGTSLKKNGYRRNTSWHAINDW